MVCRAVALRGRCCGERAVFGVPGIGFGSRGSYILGDDEVFGVEEERVHLLGHDHLHAAKRQLH